MRQPPVLPTLFIVVFLGLVNMQLKQHPLGERLHISDLFATAVVVLGTGFIFNPRAKPERQDAAAEDDDDLDQSA